MYNYVDYLRSGTLFLNNLLRPGHKRLSSLMLYATTLCQSRCKHCQIWKKPQEHLMLEDIVKVMNSRCVTSETVVGLEGGEFVLHPQAGEIMEWFSKHHRHYTLLSNCIAADKVVGLVHKFRPERLYLSLDGDREVYRFMRGVDGHDKVVSVIEACKDVVPVSLMFCLSPWNGFKDMEYVINVAKMYGVDVRIGIYGTMEFFDTTASLLSEDADSFMSEIPANIHDTDENYDYVALYGQWRNGNLRLRCHSIMNELVIHSNGDVPLCQNLGVILGNIHECTLDEIFNSKATREIQCRYSKGCNGCWINYHRKFDVILLRGLERLFPKGMIERFYGEYSWCGDKKAKYRDFFMENNRIKRRIKRI